MINLTKEEKEVVKKVIDGMSECGIFCGRYDAKNGNQHFMLGVCTAMEYLAYLVSDEYGGKFSDTFTENMIKSENKA